MYFLYSGNKQIVSLKMTNQYVFIIKAFNVFPEVVNKFLIIILWIYGLQLKSLCLLFGIFTLVRRWCNLDSAL
jgi:hypothetical protein